MAYRTRADMSHLSTYDKLMSLFKAYRHLHQYDMLKSLLQELIQQQ